jgi:hypothetical protein
MSDIEVIGDPGNEDYWREQVLLDAWFDEGCPPVDQWLADHDQRPPKHKRPGRKAAAALPPSELRNQLTLTKVQAGALLGGMSEDWVEKHVLPYVKTLHQSRSVLIDAADLQRWVHDNAERPL